MTEKTYLFDSNLSASIEDLIREAKNTLMLISPYIDLSERVKSALKEQLNKKNPDFKLKVLFGKDGKSKLTKADSNAKKLRESLEFFTQFPNIEIRFEKRLHAKFYMNDFHRIFSSMNLYNYSLENNIEFGIIEKHSSKGLIGKAVDASNELVTNIEDNIKEKVIGSEKEIDPVVKFETIFSSSELLYKTEPVSENKKGLGAKIIGTIGIKSKEVVDKNIKNGKLLELLGNQSATEAKHNESQLIDRSNEIGYCIRTGEKIPFNPDRPLSDIAFKSWRKYKDKDYEEKFCHYSGEPSNGETSFAKPILRKNWNKAKEKITFANTT